MKARLGKVLDELGASLWFVPALMALACAGAALGLIALDRRFEPEPGGSGGISALLFHGGAEGARAILTALASTMMTVTGLTFSATMVTVTLASQQYTPRLLRHFAADHVNQAVFGTLIGTFIYCLLVLRIVRSDSSDSSNPSDQSQEFVPHLAVTGAVFLAVVSVGLLIFFIHHVVTSIQPSQIMTRVATSTHRLIDELFPEPLGADETPEEVREEGLPEKPAPGIPVPVSDGNYLQAVDERALMRLAQREDLLVRMERRVGEYVPRGATLATIWRCGGRNDAGAGSGGVSKDLAYKDLAYKDLAYKDLAYKDLAERVNRCFAFGRDRTMQQDPEYGVAELADMAVKALSPGINDPTTAITCLHFLGCILRHMAARSTPSPLRHDAVGRLRVIARGTDFARMTDRALSQIRRYGEKDAEVTLQLIETVREVAEALPRNGGGNNKGSIKSINGDGCGDDGPRRRVLRAHLAEIAAGAERGIDSEAKRAQIERALGRATAAVTGKSS